MTPEEAFGSVLREIRERHSLSHPIFDVLSREIVGFRMEGDEAYLAIRNGTKIQDFEEAKTNLKQKYTHAACN